MGHRKKWAIQSAYSFFPLFTLLALCLPLLSSAYTLLALCLPFLPPANSSCLLLTFWPFAYPSCHLLTLDFPNSLFLFLFHPFFLSYHLLLPSAYVLVLCLPCLLSAYLHIPNSLWILPFFTNCLPLLSSAYPSSPWFMHFSFFSLEGTNTFLCRTFDERV